MSRVTKTTNLIPLNDNLLVEVDKLVGYEDLSQSTQTGVVVAVPMASYVSGNGWVVEDPPVNLQSFIGRTVYWKQYADKESTIEVDDKVYALIRISDLVAVEE